MDGPRRFPIFHGKRRYELTEVENGTVPAMSAIEEAAKGLIPPGADGRAIDRTLMWRLTMSAAVGGLTLAVLWGAGAFASMGWPGYARADKLDAVLNELQAQKVVRLETELRDLQRSYCSATERQSADYWLNERDKKRGDYYAITRREYPLPTCQELGTK